MDDVRLIEQDDPQDTGPDLTMPETPCDHKYVHLETVKYEDYRGTYNTRFVRIDRFFCERCLTTEEKRQEQSSRDTPEFYK